MPLDPRIPLGAQVAQIQSPFEALGQLAELQEMRERTEARRLAAEEARTKHQRQAQIDDVMQRAVKVDPVTGKVTLDRAVLAAGVSPMLIPEVEKQLGLDEESVAKLQTATLALAKAKQEHLGSAAQTVIAAGGDPTIWGVQLRGAQKMGLIDDATYDQFSAITDPAKILTVAQSLAQRAGGKPPEMMNVPAGGVVFDPVTKQPIFTNARQTPTEGFTLSPGQTRYGAGGAVVAAVPAAPGGGGAESFTLSPGQTRYGAGGQVIAAVPPSPGGSSGGRPVTSGDAGRVADLDTSRDDLAVLAGAITEAGATGTAAKIGASLPNWVTDVTGWGTDAKQKQALIDRVKQVIGKALEEGVLRKEDEYKYEKILPTIADVPAVVISKLQGLDAALVQRRQTHLDALGDAGYDVSRFQARAVRPPIGAPGGNRFTVTAPNGTTYSFNSAAELAAFKRRAGIP